VQPKLTRSRKLKKAPPDIAEALRFEIVKEIMGVGGLLHSSRFAIRVSIFPGITELALIISSRENIHRTSLEG